MIKLVWSGEEAFLYLLSQPLALDQGSDFSWVKQEEVPGDTSDWETESLERHWHRCERLTRTP